MTKKGKEIAKIDEALNYRLVDNHIYIQDI